MAHQTFEDQTPVKPGDIVCAWSRNSEGTAGADICDLGYVSRETPLTVVWIGGEAAVPDADSIPYNDNRTEFDTHVRRYDSPGPAVYVECAVRNGVRQWLVTGVLGQNIGRFRYTAEAWWLVVELPGYHLCATPDDTWLDMAIGATMRLDGGAE
jgi:hypothetical protein